jgi:hypothetical protein
MIAPLVGAPMFEVLSQPLILDKQVTNNALKSLNASLEIGFLQESLVSEFGVSGHGRWV